MLILTRRAGEQIFILPEDLPEDMTVKELFEGGRIAIQVLGVQGGQVRIGIDAPDDLAIVREEIA